MKLAEALILRADCQKRIQQLQARLIRSAKIQEGERPPEDPQALLLEVETTANELVDLIKKINKTNSQTIFEGETTISDALAQRDTLWLKRSVYDRLVQTAAVIQDRYGRSEIKTFSTVNVAELQAQVDGMSRDYRELDSKIQASNWTTELLN